jgi:hypothetical protein
MMAKTTNAGRSIANIIRRADLARDSGRWPSWKWHHASPPANKQSWISEVTRLAENGIFSVLVREVHAPGIGRVTHVAVASVCGYTNVTWAERQRIKNELFGRERTAVEVMPPESELIDEANMYHMWVMPAGYRLPFTLARRQALPD